MSIRIQRQNRGLSQEQLADFFDVSPDTLRRRDQHLLQMIMASAETARDPVARHRALQLILFVVAFFVTVF